VEGGKVNPNMKLKLKAELLRAKSILNKVSDTSYAYSQLEKDFGVTNVQDSEMAKELLDAYNQLIQDLKQTVTVYKSENEKETKQQLG